MINRLELKNFTAFDELLMDFSPGVNLIIGENGTGKTHILKLLYAILSSLKEDKKISEKLISIFLPKDDRIGRLVRRKKGSSECRIKVIGNHQNYCSFRFSNHTKKEMFIPSMMWMLDDIRSTVFIPVKEMLSHSPGFLSLYKEREIHFDETYPDVISKAFLPPRRDKTKYLAIIQKVIDGKVIVKNDKFFLKNIQGELEFDLLAEGMRKLGLLWLLINNGAITDSTSTLFWDEPETNLNPSMFETLVKVLLSLQRDGVQIFIATHSYVFLKEFDIQKKEGHAVKFFSLVKDKPTRKISVVQGDDYQSIVPNPISDEYVRLYDAEVRRSLEGRK